MGSIADFLVEDGHNVVIFKIDENCLNIFKNFMQATEKNVNFLPVSFSGASELHYFCPCDRLEPLVVLKILFHFEEWDKNNRAAVFCPVR